MPTGSNENNSEDTQSTLSNSKKDILEAALDEFAQYGMTGARVDRIAKKAGINKAMIYYYFSSKKNLYHEIITSTFAETLSAFRVKIENADRLENVLSTFSDSYARTFTRSPKMSQLILRELADPESDALSHFADTISQSGMSEMIIRLFREGIEDKTLRPIDARQAWFSFITMNIGYFLMSSIADRVLDITDRERFIEERQQAVVDLFLNGVKTR
ncbi:MAG: TetR/AcrR family transcriptional regulator [candidate division Zixibacteria bacterium]|nr:TetR/AcrR family transcriptional regulator [candidate division Zixibacteria bacterium]